MLSFIIFFPLLSVLLGFLLDDKNAKAYGVTISFIQILFVLASWFMGDFNSTGYTLVESFPIISSLGISYSIGVDGISMALIILATFVSFIAIASSPKSKRVIMAILLFQSSMIGAFASIDGIMFYIFWELNLVPMFYLIGFYTKNKESHKAAIKFFVYGFSGSVFLLIGIIYMAYLNLEQYGSFSFSMLDWAELDLNTNSQFWLFLAFGLSFAIKSPLFPFHTWLPSAHKVAPTIASILLALKMGTYGFIRFNLSLFPDASIYFYPLLISLGIITIIYGAIVAFSQKDIKLVIAYSTISHAGMVVISIFSFSNIGISGAIFLMVSHGLVAALLFLLIGILSEQANTRSISGFGGVARLMPGYATIFTICMLSFVGLPLTIGFIGEFVALLAVFKLSAWLGFLSGIGIIVGAIYMLNLFREVILSKPNIHSLKDLNSNQIILFVPFVLIIFALGIYPNILLKDISSGSSKVVSDMVLHVKNKSNKDLILEVNKGDLE